MENLRDRSSIGLEELPEECISSILSFTTPLDAARLAQISHKWRSAADSDAVWKKMLPNHYQQILRRAIIPVPYFPSMKHLYLHLCQSILVDNGTKRIWMNPSTGKIGCMMSARVLSIIVDDENRHWNWVSCEDSSFQEVAKLKVERWFELKGRFECEILTPKTRYRVSFVVKIDGSRSSIYYMRNAQISFSFSLDSVSGDHMEWSLYLDVLQTPVGRMASPIREDNGLIEFVAGEFFLEEDMGIPREIGFSMKNKGSRVIKRAISIHGVRIEPVC